MKFILFSAALMGIVLTSCTHKEPIKTGIIRSGSGYILATNVPKGPRLLMAKWDVMNIRRFENESTILANVVVDSVVVAVQMADTLRDKSGKPRFDSVNKVFRTDTSWTTNGLQQLQFSYLNVKFNPQP